VENLGDVDAAIEAVERFAEAFALSMPTGHINSFAHRTRPSLIAVVIRDDQPVNLVSAFERPVRTTEGIAAGSARKLAEEYTRSAQQWGDTPAYAAVSHAFDDSTIAEAFGTNRAFGELLSELNGTLVASWKTA